jgi:hypothetical protein
MKVERIGEIIYIIDEENEVMFSAEDVEYVISALETVRDDETQWLYITSDDGDIYITRENRYSNFSRSKDYISIQQIDLDGDAGNQDISMIKPGSVVYVNIKELNPLLRNLSEELPKNEKKIIKYMELKRFDTLNEKAYKAKKSDAASKSDFTPKKFKMSKEEIEKGTDFITAELKKIKLNRKEIIDLINKKFKNWDLAVAISEHMFKNSAISKSLKKEYYKNGKKHLAYFSIGDSAKEPAGDVESYKKNKEEKEEKVQENKLYRFDNFKK